MWGIFLTKIELPIFGERYLTFALDNIYHREAHYCVIFVSKYYKEKIWTNHQLKSALARAIQERDEIYTSN